MVNQKWLPHLTNEMMVDARGNNLCSYLVALEGWRRGLELKFYSRPVKKSRVHAPGRLFSLSSSTATHYFYKTKGNQVSRESIRITKNKDLAKNLLEKGDIPIPVGKRFLEEDTNEEILKYTRDLGYPVVLKPTKGDRGIGIVSNIQTESHLKEALLKIRKDFNDIIIERYLIGEEYRVFVVKNKVVAVLKRIPANIVGDGVHSIRKLISKKNAQRRKNPRLYSCPIKLDGELKRYVKLAGYTLESIPSKDERITLRKNSNVSTGGDSVDVTDEFPLEIKETAIKALKAMPGLAHAGVDIIVNPNLPLDKAGFVIEINAVPQIGSLVFPMIGQARDVPAALIDLYFPETKHINDINEKVYFDFKSVLQPLINKTAKEVTVSPAPKNPFYSKEYRIKGKVQNVGFRRWIRKRALESDLYGYAKNHQDGSLRVVVGGIKTDVNKFKEVCKKGPRKSNITEVSENKWERPIKVGFEIKNRPRTKKKASKIKRKKPITRMQRIKRLFRRVISKR